MEVADARGSGWAITHRAVGESPSPTTPWEISHVEVDENVDDGSMHDPRISTALRHLADLTTDRRPPAWTWAISSVDAAGRVQLPPAARRVLGAASGAVEVPGICRRVALILGDDGPPMSIDRRGRVRLPAWLRAGTTAALVGIEASTVLVAPTQVLDAVGHTLMRTAR